MDRFQRLGNAVCLGAFVLVLSQVPARVSLADPSPSGGVSIAGLIVDLDSDNYDVRNAATKRLITVGTAATVPLEAAVEQGSREVMMRAIHVLGQQARSADPVAEEAARAALGRTIQNGSKRAANRALTALSAVNRWRQSDALAELKRLGARTSAHLTTEPFAFPVARMASNQLVIGEQWRGQTEDLRRLRWLTDLRRLYLSGKQITDADIKHVVQVPNLESLAMIRTAVTDEGTAHLAEMPNLRSVEIMYSSISDEAIKHLTKLGNLRQMHLRGTNVSPSGAEALAKHLGETNLDFHRGALLGVAADRTNLAANGCPVMDAQEGSAAHGVGLRSGDVIVGVDDDKVDSFETLRRLMAKRRGGEKIVVHYRRSNAMHNVDVILGEWYPPGSTEPTISPEPQQRPDEPAIPLPIPRVYPARR